MGKLKTALIESREDANEESIRTALYPKAKGPPPKAALPANTTSKGDDGKGPKDKDEETKGLPSTSAKPKPKAKAKPNPRGDKSEPSGKGDGKGKGKGKDGKEKKGENSKSKAPAKATVECLFYPKGTCNRGDGCPFVHSKAAAKAKPPAAPATATVAFVVGASGVTFASASVASSETLKKSAWSVFKSSITALFKPLLALMSFVSNCTEVSTCNEPQGLANLATLCVSDSIG